MTAIFDAHFHIIDPRFPTKNQGFLPEPFTCEDYIQRTRHLGIIGGAIVSGSFQSIDQNYLVEALKTLGPNFVEVTQLPADVPDEEILYLHRLGVRAVRFNVHRGGSAPLSQLEHFARRIYDDRWKRPANGTTKGQDWPTAGDQCTVPRASPPVPSISTTAYRRKNLVGRWK